MSERRNIWGLRLLALALALLAWFLVSMGPREGTSVRVIDASVRYDSPREFAILDPIENVRVTIQGPASKMRMLNPFNVEVYVQPPAAEKRTFQILLSPENVLLPTDDIQVLSIEPNTLALQLDRVVTGLLPVEPRLEGEPAAGALIISSGADPGLVLVRGPESRIAQFGTLSTSPVDLTGHAIDFQEQAAVVTPDPVLQVLQPAVVTVSVQLEIPGAGQGLGGDGSW